MARGSKEQIAKLFPAQSRSRGRSLIEQIRERQTEELVFAFCGALGSGTSRIAKTVQNLMMKYNYEVHYIKVSKLIEDFSNDNEFKREVCDADKSRKTELLQEEGNRLRSNYGHDVLAQLIIKEIAMKRVHDGKDNDSNDSIDNNKEDILEFLNPKRRLVTIVDSLKHPEEYKLLSAVYGDMFYQFGVLCPEDVRVARLKNKSQFSPEQAVRLIEKDKSQDEKYGQQLLKTIHRSDFFVRNISGNPQSVNSPLKRFVRLILNEDKYTPTIAEYAMSLAYSAAMRSGCMSRQVGAAIVDKNGDIISTGRNDVPKYGGGLYLENDNSDDKRCMFLSEKECMSDKEKNNIMKELGGIVKKELGDSVEPRIVENIIDKISSYSKIKSLIEFSRAVHAEMDAITTAAKSGGIRLKDAELYCTTFPCHHCARHIVASGISKVYYIEPYEKSLAPRLHEDSITVEVSDDCTANKLLIIPFEGVAPKKYYYFFASQDRKQDGVKREVDLETSKPKIPKYLDPHVQYESRVVDYLQND